MEQEWTGERKDLVCPDCGSPMRLRPSRFGLFYGCTAYPDCKGTHGAHPDGAPLGVPASQTVKQARISAHAAFDELWKYADHLECYDPEDDAAREKIRRAARGRAYRWLASEMGRENVHIGELGEEDCFSVQALSRTMNAQAIRAWHKRRQHEREQA